MKMKKITAILLSVACLLTCMTGISPSSLAQTADDGYTYEVCPDGTVMITGCDKNVVNLVIPEKIDGKTVTMIGDLAFAYCPLVTSIVLPDTIKMIGLRAFDETVWYQAQPDGPVYLGKHLYDYKGEMPENTAINVKKGTVSISPRAFEFCPLAKVVLPDGLQYIGEGAFFSCKDLSDVTVPDSIVYIGDDAFFSTQWDAYRAPEYIGKVLYRHASGQNTQVTVKDGTLHISAGAFGGCSELVSVTIPDSVRYIDDSAFASCEQLREVKGLSGVVGIGDCAFWECIQLEQITLPERLTQIGSSAFEGCWSLTAITIPENVVQIGEHAFYHCRNLKSISIPERVTNIGSQAFGETAWYQAQPDGPVYINRVLNAYKGEMPQGTVVKVREGTVGISDDVFLRFDHLSEVVLPDSLRFIGESAFSSCDALKDVRIPAGVESIGAGAFGFCSNIKRIDVDTDNAFYCSDDGVLFTKNKETLICFPNGREGTYQVPDGVQTIGSEAFFEAKLTHITLPDSVIRIGDSAFKACLSLETMRISNRLQSIENSAFALCSQLTGFAMPDSVRCIGSQAFEGCKAFQGISVPDGVVRIGYAAFASCYQITDLMIPSSVLSIGDQAFRYCENLQAITIYPGVKSIGDSAFLGCENVTIYTFSKAYAEEYAREKAIPVQLVSQTVLYGDANADGKINAIDTMLIRQAVAELPQAYGIYTYAADMKQDGKINAADVMLIRRLVAELITQSDLPM